MAVTVTTLPVTNIHACPPFDWCATGNGVFFNPNNEKIYRIMLAFRKVTNGSERGIIVCSLSNYPYCNDVNPFFGNIADLIADTEYYCYAFVLVEGYFAYGDKVYFKTSIREMHFKAYGVAGDGNIYYGDDMEFEY